MQMQQEKFEGVKIREDRVIEANEDDNGKWAKKEKFHFDKPSPSGSGKWVLWPN
jgi:hypothetical protein